MGMEMEMGMGTNGTKLQQFEFCPTFHALPFESFFLQSLWQMAIINAKSKTIIICVIAEFST